MKCTFLMYLESSAQIGSGTLEYIPAIDVRGETRGYRPRSVLVGMTCTGLSAAPVLLFLLPSFLDTSQLFYCVHIWGGQSSIFCVEQYNINWEKKNLTIKDMRKVVKKG